MSKVEFIEFHGAKLPTFKDDFGVAYVAIRPIVEALGLDWKSQYVKLTAQKDRYGVVLSPYLSNGGEQLSTSIPVKKLNGWLFGINSARVRSDLREKLIEFQEECFVALHDFWMVGLAVNTRNNPTQLQLFTELPELDGARHVRLSDAWWNLVRSGIVGRPPSKEHLKTLIRKKVLKGYRAPVGYLIEEQSFNDFCARLKLRI